MDNTITTKYNNTMKNKQVFTLKQAIAAVKTKGSNALSNKTIGLENK